MSGFNAAIFVSFPRRCAMTSVCLWAATAGANDLETSMFTFSGFGTAGIVHSSEGQGDFTNSPSSKPNGAGHSRNWSADVDSRLGLQVTADITPQLSAVLQVLSQQRYDNTYTPRIEWANVKYAVTPDLSVRVGRIAMPTFLVGEYRNVGYAVPWVRPPVELYGHMVPITSNDGLDASYRSRMGDATNTLQASFGRDEIQSPNSNIPSQVKNIAGIFNTLDYGAATFRLSYQQAKLTVGSINDFLNQYRQFGSSGVALAEKYVFDSRPISLVSLGASYDPGSWFVMGEWGKGRFSSFVGTQTAWYASGGYRFGNFTPYAVYSKATKQGDTADAGVNSPYAAPLNEALNQLLKPATGTTRSIGSRWDYTKNGALKLQYDHVNLDARSSGSLLNLQSGFQPGGTFHVISASVDFVF
jgi:hypothetical protein